MDAKLHRCKCFTQGLSCTELVTYTIEQELSSIQEHDILGIQFSKHVSFTSKISLNAEEIRLNEYAKHVAAPPTRHFHYTPQIVMTELVGHCFQFKVRITVPELHHILVRGNC